MVTRKDTMHDRHLDGGDSRPSTVARDWEASAEDTSRAAEYSLEGRNPVLQIVKDHPWSTVTVGLGLGWLAYETTLGIGPRRRLKKLSRSARGQWKAGRSVARRAWRSLRRTAVDGVETVQDSAVGAVSQVRSRAGDARRDLRELVRERPLVAGLATLGVGVLVGAWLPSSRGEDSWMGRTRDEVVSHAKSDASDVVRRGKDIARTAVNHLRDDAEAEGLTPEDLRRRAE